MDFGALLLFLLCILASLGLLYYHFSQHCGGKMGKPGIEGADLTLPRVQIIRSFSDLSEMQPGTPLKLSLLKANLQFKISVLFTISSCQNQIDAHFNSTDLSQESILTLPANERQLRNQLLLCPPAYEEPPSYAECVDLQNSHLSTQ